MRKEFLFHEKCKSNSFKVCQINKMFGRKDEAHIILGFKVESKKSHGIYEEVKNKRCRENADLETGKPSSNQKEMTNGTCKSETRCI